MKKMAVVTGANRGIGLAFCRQLVNEGYKVVGICRQSSAELNKLDIRVINKIDFSDLEAIKNINKNLNHEPIDLLINNAGIGLQDDIQNLDFTKIHQHFFTNACGPLAVTLSLLPSMKPKSKIAFISSRLSSVTDNSSSGSYSYRMSKAALNMCAKNLSIDLKDKGIAVAALSPGMVDTDMLRVLGITQGADAAMVVTRLMKIIDNLNLENTGTFWHVDGSVLSW